MHGDTPEAVQIAREVRQKLSLAGVEITAF
jgi:lactam utilization protein B